MNDDKVFHGRGWSFPPTFTVTAGTVAMREGVADIEESLRVLISTIPGERVMKPEYGGAFGDLLFDSLDTGTQTLFFDRLQDAIILHEPRIDVIDLSLNLDQLPQGLVDLELSYRVRVNNSRFNFVYPFYLEEGSLISQQ